MNRIVNKEIVPAIEEAIKVAEDIVKNIVGDDNLAKAYIGMPLIHMPTAHIPIFSTFKGIKDQLDSFTQPVGLIWVIAAYDSINHIILMSNFAVNIGDT